MSKKIVAVVGATGTQGASTVDALLKDGSYTIRALTRNTDSDAAKALAAKGVQLAQADANDISSLTAAFKGVYAIYAITDFFAPFAEDGPVHASETESRQGINLAKAASATESLEHYIWSTLPSGKAISNGQFTVPHFEAKNVVDRYIKSDAKLLAKTTFLWITFYAQNYYFPMFTPIHVPTAGKYIQISSTPPSVPILSIGDARTNIGIFVRAILAQPQKTRGGKTVLGYSDKTTAGEMLQTWAKAQGKQAQFVEVDREAFHAVWPMWAEEIGVMMEFWNVAGDKGWSGEDVILTKDDLEVEGLVGVEEAFSVLKF